MSHRVVIWARAERDLAEHYAVIALDKRQPAERLLEMAEESFIRLAEHPSIGLLWKSKRPALRGLRHYPMPPPYRSYVIFYRELDDLLEIVAILHGARDLDRAIREAVQEE